VTANDSGRGKLPPLLLLHPDDNILVARRDIAAGERVELDGESFVIPAAVELGHKLARRALAPDTRVLKYGAPIGSMKTAAARGEHVHLHNLRSDYIPSTTREGTDGH
jgi:(2R)-sulfolactate sulfo-lyase subunit alpha